MLILGFYVLIDRDKSEILKEANHSRATFSLFYCYFYSFIFHFSFLHFNLNCPFLHSYFLIVCIVHVYYRLLVKYRKEEKVPLTPKNEIEMDWRGESKLNRVRKRLENSQGSHAPNKV